jgi:hypothetical protein
MDLGLEAESVMAYRAKRALFYVTESGCIL